MTELGQIGLGAVGMQFAQHLLEGVGKLAVCDIDAARTKTAVEKGATAFASPAALAAACNVILLSLPAPDAVEAAMLGDDGVLSGGRAGLLVIDCSTIDPDTCRRIHAATAERGIGYVEAPISGGEPLQAGTEGALHKSVTFMVGGDTDDVERARPVLSMLGRYIHHLGPSGAGATVKLISNHMAGLHNLVCAEAFVLGAAAGFSCETLLEVFATTDAKSYMMSDYIAPRLKRGDFSPGFAVDLMYKDHRLAGELAQKLSVPLLFNPLAQEVYQMLRAQGAGRRDLVDAINLFARLAGRESYASAAAGADMPARP